MAAYYNEIEPFAAEWLRNLIAAGHIAPGDVDERSIEDVSPDDLRGYRQCHFFAGIGVWSHALRLAGWEDDREVWTGSCPCQPFSAAGKGKGFTDERHLWPAWHHLIAERNPSVVFGEQVASKDGLGWLDLVQADMEGTGYAFGAVDLCAAGVGAPHIRQRLWFVGVADAMCSGQQGPRLLGRPGDTAQEADWEVSGALDAGGCGWMADAADTGCERRRTSEASDGRDAPREQPERLCDDSGMGNASGFGRQPQPSDVREYADGVGAGGGKQVVRVEASCDVSDKQPATGPTNGFWRDADWLFCRDGKWRPVEPGTFPLAHGAPSRVGRLRAYGNAISPWAAKEVIQSFREAEIFL